MYECFAARATRSDALRSAAQRSTAQHVQAAHARRKCTSCARHVTHCDSTALATRHTTYTHKCPIFLETSCAVLCPPRVCRWCTGGGHSWDSSQNWGYGRYIYGYYYCSFHYILTSCRQRPRLFSLFFLSSPGPPSLPPLLPLPSLLHRHPYAGRSSHRLWCQKRWSKMGLQWWRRVQKVRSKLQRQSQWQVLWNSLWIALLRGCSDELHGSHFSSRRRACGEKSLARSPCHSSRRYADTSWSNTHPEARSLQQCGDGAQVRDASQPSSCSPLVLHQPGAEPRQAPRPLVSILEAIERTAVDSRNLLLQTWCSLRFDDHRGLEPALFRNSELGVLTRSKTHVPTRGYSESQCSWMRVVRLR